jgi:hypothetical protein
LNEDRVFGLETLFTGYWLLFLTKLYFVLLLVFGGIVGLLIVNSIFLDAKASDNNDALEEDCSKSTQNWHKPIKN